MQHWPDKANWRPGIHQISIYTDRLDLYSFDYYTNKRYVQHASPRIKESVRLAFFDDFS